MIDSTLPGTVRLRLVFFALASEGLYLFWAARSRLPAEEGLLASWYRPVLFEETLEFLGAWALLFLVYALAARSSARAPQRGLTTFISATSAIFRVTLAIAGRFETTSAPAFLGVAGPLASPLAEIASRLPWEAGAVRAALGIGADLFALALAPGMLRAAGLPVGLALLQGWNPLLVKEVAATPRVEIVFSLATILLGVRLLQRARPGLSAVALGVGLGGWPALGACLPAMARLLRARALVAAAIPLGLWTMARPSASWSSVLGWPPGDDVGGSLLPSFETICRLFLSRDPMVPLVAAGALWCVVTIRALGGLKADGSNLPRALLPSVGFLILLAPQARPWSFLPLAYLAPYSPNRGWLAFTATAPMIYLALGGGDWSFWLGFASTSCPTRC